MLFAVLAFFGITAVDYKIKSFNGRYKPNEYGVYRDKNGDERCASNLKRVYRTSNFYGDTIYKYASSGEELCNIDLIESEKRRAKAISFNEQFYLRQTDNGKRRNMFGYDRIRGDRYCKVNSKKATPDNVYVPRDIKYRMKNGHTYYGSFFMDMNCKLCCPTDKTLRKDKDIRDKDSLYDAIISEWNSTKKWKDVTASNVYTLGTYSKSDIKYYKDKLRAIR